MAGGVEGMRVCVIIPSLRNHDELGIVLDGLSNQTWPNENEGSLEVIVVGPSDDPGKTVASQKGARFVDDEGSRTRADACNVALREIDCDLLIYGNSHEAKIS